MRVVTNGLLTVREIENVWIPMPDGVRLAARVWLPADAERHPVPAIVECIPYRKRDGTVDTDPADASKEISAAARSPQAYGIAAE